MTDDGPASPRRKDRSDVVDKGKLQEVKDRSGEVGPAVLWLLGVPLPILLVL